MRKFKIYTRRMNDADWAFYGEFTSEQDFRNELPNIRSLGLAIKRVDNTFDTDRASIEAKARLAFRRRNRRIFATGFTTW